MTLADTQNYTADTPSAWWTAKRERAVELVVADELSDEAIADELGVTRKTLYTWRSHPEFEARRKALIMELREHARHRGLARLDVRLERYTRRAAALDMIPAERAADPDMQDVPGGRSGFLVRQYKSIGTGPNARQVEEYHFDAALHREMRELEKQAAQDAGDWSDKAEVSGPGGEALTVVFRQREDGPQ